MKLTIILVLCACVWLSAGDVAHLKAAKAKLLGRLAGRARHHKRGILSSVPPFKLGYDIPHVTHSVVKPLVVSYPPTASVTAVKVPLVHPLIHRHPVPVGHKVPVPHPHYGLKFPHSTKAFVVPKPDQHYHHHHHHVAPRPIVPVVHAAPLPATPLVPVGQPTATIAHPIPAPSPSVVIPPTPIVPAAPIHHVFPQPIPVPPPVHLLPPDHLHLKPIGPAPVPIQPAQVVSPLIPLQQQYPYFLRPGNAVQTSVFATYPRYPLLNYQSPYIPLTPTGPASLGPVFFDRPEAHIPQPQVHFVPQGGQEHGVLEQHLVPQGVQGHGVLEHHLVPQAGHEHGVLEHHLVPQGGHEHGILQHNLVHQGAHEHGVLEQHGPQIVVEPTPTLLHPTQPTLHLQPTQPGVDHNGWSPVTSPHDLTPTQHPEAHFPQPQDAHHHFTQEQGNQVFEHHTDEQYHDYQHQLQHHIQQQIEQAQYEQHLNNQHQLGQEYGAPQNLGQEYGQPNQDFNNQEFIQAQQHAQQEYAHQAHEYAQHGQEFGQHGHEFAQHGQEFAQNGQEFTQHGQDFNLGQQQPSQEYGVPQGAEGRSAEGEGDTQRFHNHIPLGLQPPIDRPLEHFR